MGIVNRYYVHLWHKGAEWNKNIKRHTCDWLFILLFYYLSCFSLQNINAYIEVVAGFLQFSSPLRLIAFCSIKQETINFTSLWCFYDESMWFFDFCDLHVEECGQHLPHTLIAEIYAPTFFFKATLSSARQRMSFSTKMRSMLGKFLLIKESQIRDLRWIVPLGFRS